MSSNGGRRVDAEWIAAWLGRVKTKAVTRGRIMTVDAAVWREGLITRLELAEEYLSAAVEIIEFLGNEIADLKRELEWDPHSVAGVVKEHAGAEEQPAPDVAAGSRPPDKGSK